MEVVRITRGGRLLFALCGDFNCRPEVLAQSAWLVTPDAVILLPCNAEATCWATAEGSLIDYMIVSKRLAHAIRLEALASVPWVPHVALHWQLCYEAAAWTVQSLNLPRPLPPPLEEASDDSLSSPNRSVWSSACETTKSQWPAKWRASSLHECPALFRHSAGATALVGTTSPAWLLGEAIGGWLHSWEIYSLRRAGVDPQSRQGLASRGRGLPVGLRAQRMAPPRPRPQIGPPAVATAPLALRLLDT